MASRTVLKTTTIPALPGYELRTLLLEFQPYHSAPTHIHPVEGTNYIVQGTLLSRWADGPTETLGAGESFLDYADIPHKVDNGGSEILKIVASYVVKVGEPQVIQLENKK